MKKQFIWVTSLLFAMIVFGNGCAYLDKPDDINITFGNHQGIPVVKIFNKNGKPYIVQAYERADGWGNYELKGVEYVGQGNFPWTGSEFNDLPE